MYYSIPSSNYKINENFEIIFKDGKVCNLPSRENDSGGVEVEILVFGKKLFRPVVWLYGIAKLNIYREVCAENTIFIKVPYKMFGLDFFFEHIKSIYCDSKNIYRYVPGFCKLAVDRYGNVINTETLNQYYQKSTRNDYTYISVRTPDKVRRIGIHRLVALAWVKNLDPLRYNVVNHLNAIKNDNRASNLEWTDSQGNSRHAAKYGLVPNSNKCRLRDIETGEIIEFNTQNLAKEFLGISGTTSSDFTRLRQENFLFKDRYELRIDGDDRPWFYENVNLIKRPRSQFVFKVTDENGNVTLINSIPEAARFFGLSHRSHSVTVSKVLAKAKRDFSNLQVEVIDMQPNNNRIIQVLDIENDKVKEFSSIQKACEYYNLPGNLGIRRSIASNGGRVYNGFRFRYKSEDEWPTANNRSHISDPVKIQVINKSSGETKIFNSLREVSRELKISRASIRRIIKKNRDRDDYIITEIGAQQS